MQVLLRMGTTGVVYRYLCTRLTTINEPSTEITTVFSVNYKLYPKCVIRAHLLLFCLFIFRKIQTSVFM